MTEILNYEILVLSFDNPKREQSMISRFKSINLKANIKSITDINPKINDEIRSYIKKEDIRTLDILFSMINLIEEFYNNSQKDYGVFLENDVFLKKSLEKDLIKVCESIKLLELDILLIGYLITNTPCTLSTLKYKKIHTDDNNNKYYNYPDDLWGSHGFILTKKHAKYIIDRYTVSYVLDKNRTEVLSPDWTITKQGRRAMVYPPLVVEEGVVNTDHAGQVLFHKRCKEFMYNNLFTL